MADGLRAANEANRCRVLLLGGTAEARDLADRLVQLGVPVTSSLAGRVSHPRLPVGEVRVGGFGGVTGLVDYLREHEVIHIVDATHPFAAVISDHARRSAELARVDLLRLERPGWRQHPHADAWHWVDSLDAAREVAGQLGRRPFLTSGRQGLPAFLSWHDRDVLVRVVEPLDIAVPARWTVLQRRGPYLLDAERDLMREHRVDVLVTKDSGGSYTAAKLDAARELGVPVVVVRRPGGGLGVETVGSVDAAVAWLSERWQAR